MSIERVIVRNYRALSETDVELRPDINIIVGDNESGKSTLLEAINLALKCQINRRPAPYELHQYLFNTKSVAEFVEQLRAGKHVTPPEILIEIYFADSDKFADLKGINNSLGENQPGISLAIRLDEDTYKAEYEAYIAKPDLVAGVPVEYYEVVWQTFAGDRLKARTTPVRSCLIDPSAISDTYAAGKYIVEFTRDYLSKKEQVDVALSYRKMRDSFCGDAAILRINTELAKKKGTISDKRISIAMDMTARSSWESSLVPHLDDIPITLAGKGEQSCVKLKLALMAEEAADIVLIEEPENHLSHTNLNKLISQLSAAANGKQLIIATHSSFVLNKLGIERTQLFNGKVGISIAALSKDTREYFKRLPGHNTLRMILARQVILVEGPSDELIVQKAFLEARGGLPIEAGVEVISVNSLAFRRFLEIGKALKIPVRVVIDNDGKAESVRERFKDFKDDSHIKLCLSDDNNLKTLENHLISANGLEKLNTVLGAQYASEEGLLEFMLANKTECALKVFESAAPLTFPKYISDAIE